MLSGVFCFVDKLFIHCSPFIILAKKLPKATGNFFSSIVPDGKQTQENLFQSKILDIVGESVIVTDTNGKIVFWNKSAEKTYGWKASEVFGQNITDITVPQASQQDAKQIMQQLSQGKRWSGEFLVQRKDGTTFYALVDNSPLLDDKGQLAGIVGVSIDISERKKAEASLKKK
jgi:PAS domain S-box-containing protein